MKKELEVAAIENGTVIDHIPSEKLFTIVSLLGLDKMENAVTIGFNLASKKMGKKSLIKVAGKFFTDEEINRLSLVAPNVVLNIIKNYASWNLKGVKYRTYSVIGEDMGIGLKVTGKRVFFLSTKDPEARAALRPKEAKE